MRNFKLAVSLFLILAVGAGAFWAVWRATEDQRIDEAQASAPTSAAPAETSTSSLAPSNQLDRYDWSEESNHSSVDERTATTTTTTTIPDPPPSFGCSSPHTEEFWNVRRGWICRQLTAEDAGVRCERMVNPRWDRDSELWWCPPPPTTTTRPPRPECPKGEHVVWLRDAASWGSCQRPEPPSCWGEYPDLLWVNGEWSCYSECGAGYESYTKENGEPGCRALCEAGETRVIKSEGNVLCYPPCEDGEWQEIMADESYVCWHQPECGAELDVARVSGEGQICIPTEVMSSAFWASAFSQAGLPDTDKRGKWIGGLAKSYDHAVFFATDERPYWEDELGIYEQGEWGIRDEWGFVERQSFAANLLDVQQGIAHVHVCYGHDCFREGNCPDRECGLIGSTDPVLSHCRVYVWDDAEGLWFLMQVNGTEVCLSAFERVAASTMNQASFSSSCHKEVVGSQDKDGIEYPLKRCYDGILEEITLTASGRDKNTWVTARDYG